MNIRQLQQVRDSVNDQKMDALIKVEMKLHTRLDSETGLEWTTLRVDKKGNNCSVKLQGKLILEFQINTKDGKVTMTDKFHRNPDPDTVMGKAVKSIALWAIYETEKEINN